MKTIPNYTIVLAMACLCCSSQRLEAKIKYRTGTPRQDLAALVRNARANTAFLLTPGTYRLKPQDPPLQGVLLENKSNVAIIGKNRDATRIELSAGMKFGFYIGSNLSNVTIQGLTISGTLPLKENTHAIGNYSGSTKIKGLRFTNLKIEKVAVGISIAAGENGSYSDVSVDRNIIGPTIGTDAGWGYGIHIENATNVRVSDNFIRECTRHSIYLARAAKGSNVRIENNLILDHDPASKQPRWYCAALVCSRSSDVIISGNLVVDPRTVAISVEPDEFKAWPTKNISLFSNRGLGARRGGLWLTTDGSCEVLANKVTLYAAPPDPQWCLETSTYDYARGKETKSSFKAPQERWAKAEHTAMLGDQLYIMTGGILDQAETKTWTFETCPKKWENVRGLVALENAVGKSKHRLYVVTDTGIDEVNPARWKIKDSKGDWKDTRYVTTAGGYIHLLVGDVLHRVSPKSPGSRSTKKPWSGTKWICPLGDRIFLSSSVGNYLINPKTLEGVKLGDKKAAD
ncbi:MAG: right-handed parallel beta-helix repeat-containing protein [Planctomycetes bacterium]|nr:right-handed parallel beta-helix repeat-containing protein [Planctomycetota bacterium]